MNIQSKEIFFEIDSRSFIYKQPFCSDYVFCNATLSYDVTVGDKVYNATYQNGLSHINGDYSLPSPQLELAFLMLDDRYIDFNDEEWQEENYELYTYLCDLAHDCNANLSSDPQDYLFNVYGREIDNFNDELETNLEYDELTDYHYSQIIEVAE